jgi:methylmalonyl-CoA mutase N-terminal domain/subunit
LRVDPALRKIQSEKLAKLKAERDNSQVRQLLAKLREAARNDKINLMPIILETVKAYATLGEICSILREEFGEYQESIVL